MSNESNNNNNNSNNSDEMNKRMQALQNENERLMKQIEQMTQTLSIIVRMIMERSPNGELPPFLAQLLNDYNINNNKT